MIQRISLFILAFSGCFLLRAQNTMLPVVYYFSTGDYIEDKRSDTILIEVSKMDDQYIYVKNFLDPKTEKKVDDGGKIWALRYNDEDYVNLLYSGSAYSPKFFIRVDIKGRFCAALMEPGFDKILSENWLADRMAINGVNHPTDNTVGAYFKDEAGLDRRIFLIDTKDLSIVLPYKAKNAPVEMINKSTLKWLTGDSYKGSVKDYTADEVMKIIVDLNGRQ
jgi:hypothetical protein